MSEVQRDYLADGLERLVAERDKYRSALVEISALDDADPWSGMAPDEWNGLGAALDAIKIAKEALGHET